METGTLCLGRNNRGRAGSSAAIGSWKFLRRETETAQVGNYSQDLCCERFSVSLVCDFEPALVRYQRGESRKRDQEDFGPSEVWFRWVGRHRRPMDLDTLGRVAPWAKQRHSGWRSGSSLSTSNSAGQETFVGRIDSVAIATYPLNPLP